jgi:uncharacterized Zn finger protein
MMADKTLEIIRVKRLIERAIQLKFWDEVAHWRAELKKLEAENKES